MHAIAKLLESDWQTAQAPETEDDVAVMRRYTLDELDTTHHASVGRAVQRARDWRQRRKTKPGASLVLCGPNGVGKTHIARAIWWSIIDGVILEDHTIDMRTARPAGRWFDSAELLARLGSQDGVPPQVSMLVGNAPMVIVDDFGSEGSLQYVARDDQQREKQARWFRFFDWMYVNERPLIMTTNLSLGGQLQDYLGLRVWDRLHQMCGQGYLFDFGAVPSYRSKLR